MGYYETAMHDIDTAAALNLLGLKPEVNGMYAKFVCPTCGKQATANTYGDHKNLIWCTGCKKGYNIITLTIQIKGQDWTVEKFEKNKLAIDILKRAVVPSVQFLTEELKLNYQLEHNKYLEEKGLSADMCALLGIGQPKGKTMLAGHVAFTVHNEQGTRIAYWGLNPDKMKEKFHHTFNPELYLYNFHRVDREGVVVFTESMLECAKLMAEGQPAVCNFYLDYLSHRQIELLNTCKMVDFRLCDTEEIKRQAIGRLTCWMRFN